VIGAVQTRLEECVEKAAKSGYLPPPENKRVK